MRFNKTSNPAFSNYFWQQQPIVTAKMSVNGIVLKTLTCLILISGIVVYTWHLYQHNINLKWFTSGGMLVAIVLSILISYNKNWAPFLVPFYAIAKGFFLGGITSYAYAKFPNLPFQAIAVTIITFFAVLFLYQTRIIIVTNKLRSIIIIACSSIFLVYIISWILSFFGLKSFVWGTSWAAILFNIIAAVFASLTFLLDFNFIERQKNHAPKNMEWFATWGLLVSIVWLYVEILRLLKKFAIRF